MLRNTVIALTVLSLAACDLRADVVMPSETPPSATEKPWNIGDKTRYNDLFALSFDVSNAGNPLTVRNRFNDSVCRLVCEPLFEPDERFEPVPVLCASYSTEDYTEYTLTLRPDALFSDGAPLTAADAVFSVKTALGLDASVLDDLTLSVKLKKPNPRLPALLTCPIVRADGAEFPYIGTGLYMFVPPDGDGGLRLEGNPYRTDKKPLGRIELCDASAVDQLPYQLGVGDVSLAVEDGADSFAPAFRGDFERWAYPTAILSYLSPNPKSVFADSAARRAVSAALDRAALTQLVYADAAVPAAFPVPSASPLYRDMSVAADGRVFAETCDLLFWEDSEPDGYLDMPSGKTRVPVTLRVLVDERDSKLRLLAEETVKQLSAAGFMAGLVAAPPGSRANETDDILSRGEYEFYLTTEYLTADFQNWDLDAFADDLPVLPLCFRVQTLLTRRGMVTGANPVYGNPFYKFEDWAVKH